MRVPQPSRFVRRTILTVGLIAVVSQMVSLGACCCPHQATGPCPVMSVAALRFDGVYQRTTTDSTVDRNTYWYYIRFYADGRVLTVTTSAPWRFAAWFNWDEPGRSVGHFDRRGDRLAFSSVSREGSVDYDGTVDGDTLHLRWLSHINGHRGESLYTFVPWATTAAAPASTARPTHVPVAGAR